MTLRLPHMNMDEELIRVLKDSLFFWRLSHVYRSNWRVLHIDGFEGGRRLPISNVGKTIQFFTYEGAEL